MHKGKGPKASKAKAQDKKLERLRKASERLKTAKPNYSELPADYFQQPRRG